MIINIGLHCPVGYYCYICSRFRHNENERGHMDDKNYFYTFIIITQGRF